MIGIGTPGGPESFDRNTVMFKPASVAPVAPPAKLPVALTTLNAQAGPLIAHRIAAIAPAANRRPPLELHAPGKFFMTDSFAPKGSIQGVTLPGLREIVSQ